MARFDIVDTAICDCGEQYQTIDHILWECDLRANGRSQMVSSIINEGLPTGDVRYLVCPGILNFNVAVQIHIFLARHKLRI